MARLGADDSSIGLRVQSVLRELANLSHDEVQQVFRDIATFPPVCAAALNRTAALLTNVLEESKEESDEGSDEPRRRSQRVKKLPPTLGTRHSPRKKDKAIAVDSSSEEWQSKQDRSDTAEEDSKEDDDAGDDDDEEVHAVGVVSGKEVALKTRKSHRQVPQKLEVSVVTLQFFFWQC
jgi:hypothetical protein